jgi:hypothetical protein
MVDNKMNGLSVRIAFAYIWDEMIVQFISTLFIKTWSKLLVTAWQPGGAESSNLQSC